MKSQASFQSDPLLAEIVGRSLKYKEAKQRVDFDTFLAILKSAMNLRSNEHSARLVFNLFDTDKSGLLHTHKIHKISEQIGAGLKMDQIKSIVESCGSREHKAITFENFMKMLDNHQMKRVEINVEQADTQANEYNNFL